MVVTAFKKKKQLWLYIWFIISINVFWLEYSFRSIGKYLLSADFMFLLGFAISLFLCLMLYQSFGGRVGMSNGYPKPNRVGLINTQ